MALATVHSALRRKVFLMNSETDNVQNKVEFSKQNHNSTFLLFFFFSLHFLFLVLRHTTKSLATEHLNFTRAVKSTDNKKLILKARERDKTSSLTR